MPARLPLIDALKAVASQLIVLHHLAFYGPMAEALRPVSHGVVDALAEHGRLAVQVFLVLAGWLSARALAPGAVPRAGLDPWAAIARRARRLAGPYWGAIALAVLAAWAAREIGALPSTPAAPSAGQLLANLAMVQDLVGVEALSAGAWYVAIDLQLYAVATLAVAAAARVGRPGVLVALVAAGTLASLLAFNRIAALDAWAPYFLGAYGLGMLAAWAGEARRPAAATLALAAIAACALAWDWRSRIAVASAAALLVALAWRRPALMARPASPVLGWLGRISFSVFLVHYPVLVLIEAAWARLAPAGPASALVGLAAAWALAVALGAAFHRHVERRFAGGPGPRGGAAADAVSRRARDPSRIGDGLGPVASRDVEVAPATPGPR